MLNDEALPDDLENLIGRVLDDRYVLEKFLDRGGYGAVYRGADRKFNQPVAIKVGYSSREFMKEARLAAEVKHNHIVQVSDFGSDQGLAYLVMEFLQGDDLEKLFLKQEHRLTQDQLRKLVNEVGDALAHAHADHLIHRDLKPRNIILKESLTKAGVATSTSKFVLLDFGIAAKLDSEGTQRNRTQDGAGTVEYMAPELLGRNPKATELSDLYAFGVILYQMMTGQVPFPQSDTSHMALADCLSAISTKAAPSFGDVAPDRDWPHAVEDLVLDCLEKDPARRPQSMADLRRRFLDLHDHASSTIIPRKPRQRTIETARPSEFTDTAQRVDNVQRKPAQARNLSGASWLLICAVVLIAIVLGVTQQVRSPGLSPYLSVTDERGVVIDENTPLVLTAGKSVILTFAVNDLPRDAVVDFEANPSSKLIKVEMAKGPIPGTSKNLIVVAPDLNSTVTEPAPIVLLAKTPFRSTTLERSVKLRIERPNAWMPAELANLGFRESPDSWRCQVGDKVFAAIIDRSIKGKSVRFRLVPASRVGDRTIDTFYIMEHLVTNGLFDAFAKSQVDFEFESRQSNQRRWELDQVANAPVTNIHTFEAQKFAWWLAGRQFGSLPSTMEWELAMGYWDFVRLVEAKYGPIHNMKPGTLQNLRPMQTRISGLAVDVWIGSGPSLCQFQSPYGELLKERSPYGCDPGRLQTGKRPMELTRTISSSYSTSTDLLAICHDGIPASDDSRAASLFEATLVGSGDNGEEISWLQPGEEIVKTQEALKVDGLALFPPMLSVKETVGFRIVILIEVTPR